MTDVCMLLLDCVQGRDLNQCHPTLSKYQHLDAREPKKHKCYRTKRDISCAEDNLPKIYYSLERFVFLLSIKMALVGLNKNYFGHICW